MDKITVRNVKVVAFRVKPQGTFARLSVPLSSPPCLGTLALYFPVLVDSHSFHQCHVQPSCPEPNCRRSQRPACKAS